MDRRVLLAFLLLLLATPVRTADEPLARVGLPGETGSTARRLEAVARMAAEQQWPEAVDECQRILDEASDDLVRHDPRDPRHLVPARWLCHRRLASLPAEALRLYREKVDTPAKKWLTQGEAEREPRLLRKVVDDAFCSRSGDRALDLLGDLAFERGNFDEAERWWRLLVPAIGEKKDEALHFPDPQVDPARIRAKQLLARLFRGERDQAELAAYRKEHGPSAGSLAGRKGTYADILQALAEQTAAPVEAPAFLPEEAMTFAAGPDRNQLLGRAPRLDRRGPLERPTWTARLEPPTERPSAKESKVVPLAVQARSLAFHPVIVGDQVLVADARSVTAFELLTGKKEVWFDLVTDGKVGGLDLALALPAPPDLRYTLTVAEGRVFARLGAQAIAPPEPAKAKDAGKKGYRDSYLVCLRSQPGPDGSRLCWPPVKASLTDLSTEMFEGAPLVHEGRVYIAVTRFNGAVTTAIACYDAERGAPLWRQAVDVCEIHDHRQSGRRFGHHLLSLVGSTVVYCSHSGAIVAVDAQSGRRAWAVRYPSRGVLIEDARPSPRDLAPCVYAEGRLFVAPSDYDRILCLDPLTGKMLWESQPPVEVVHLLGAAHGRLIFTTPHDLRAVDVTTGRTIREWICPEEGQLPPFGRGLLAGHWVLWPTAQGLRVLDLQTGKPDPNVPCNDTPNDLRGNLAIGQGCLVVADTTRLYAYVPPGRFLEQRRKEAREDGSAAAILALADAEADAGLYDQARNNFAKVEEEAGPLRALARTRRHEVLLDQAQQAQAARRWEEAASFLDRAAVAEFSTPERLQALRRHAQLWVSGRQPARAVAVWQDVLRESARAPERGSALAQHAAAEIEVLMAAQGVAVYAAVEDDARKLLASAQGERRQEVLERLVREYPGAAVTGSGLLQLAELHVGAGRPGAAAHAYRLFLKRPYSSAAEERVTALLGLARAYESQACWEAARSTWQRLAHDFGERTLGARRLGVVVATELAKPPYRTRDPSPWLSLTQTWEISLASSEASSARLLVPDHATALDCLFFTRDRDKESILACHDAATGKQRWTQPLSLWERHGRRGRGEGLWSSCHADTVLVAGAHGIHCFSRADGVSLWSWESDGAGARSALAHFRLAAGRLFFLEDERRCWALDAETGRALWQRGAPSAELRPLGQGGRFLPYFHADERRVLLQTAGGKLWVLDSATGRTIYETVGAELWARPPVPLDERRLCLVSGSQRVVLLDPATGKEHWARDTPKPSVSGEPPCFVTDGKTLLLWIDGWQLERLDPATGETLWRVGEPRWLADQGLETGAAVFDGTSVYMVRRNILQARSVADGKQLWELSLDGSRGPWQIRLVHDRLLVFPLAAERRQRRALVGGGYLLAVSPIPQWHDFPLLLSSKEGKLLQRLTFPAAGPTVALQVVERGAVVGVAGRVWGLRAGD